MNGPYDPYQAPQHQPYGSGYNPYGSGTSSDLGLYQPLGWKTMATAVGVVINLVLGLVLGVLPMTLTEPDKNLGMLAVIGLVGLLSSGIGIGIIIIFLLWIHQAAKNVRAFGQQMLEITPGWAVGWWFIPFANMWMPFKAVREIWRASDPDAVTRTGEGTSWTSRPSSPLLVLWWIAYQLNGIIGGIVAVRQLSVTLANPHAHQPNLGGGPATLIAHTFLIVSAVALISWMRQLAARQEACAAKLRG